jgi:hypothetical protein
MATKGDLPEREAFNECVQEIVNSYPTCGFESLYYEANGRWARLLFHWADANERTKLVHALQGEDVIDLLSVTAVNKLGPY